MPAQPVADQELCASSHSVFAAWITRILNIATGSYGGRPPCAPSEYPSAFSRSARKISRKHVHGRKEQRPPTN